MVITCRTQIFENFGSAAQPDWKAQGMRLYVVRDVSEWPEDAELVKMWFDHQVWTEEEGYDEIVMETGELASTKYLDGTNVPYIDVTNEFRNNEEAFRAKFAFTINSWELEKI